MKSVQRLSKEFRGLLDNPSPGITVDSTESGYSGLVARIEGPEDSAYAGGSFLVRLQIPVNYPFEPPKAQFITPIYHPNIDGEGRICLDTLKPQPQGSWSPSINLNTLLLSLRLLMSNPNAEDGLVPDITEQYKRSRASYVQAAKQHTLEHAILFTGRSSAQIGSFDNVSTQVRSNAGGMVADADSRGSNTGTVAGCINITTADESVAYSGVVSEGVESHPESANIVEGTNTINASTNTISMSEGGESYMLCGEGYTLIGCNNNARAVQCMQIAIAQAQSQVQVDALNGNTEWKTSSFLTNEECASEADSRKRKG